MSKFVPQILREFSVVWAGSEEWSVHSTWFAKQTGVLMKLGDIEGQRGYAVANK
jgi:hypothetical protein